MNPVSLLPHLVDNMPEDVTSCQVWQLCKAEILYAWQCKIRTA